MINKNKLFFINFKYIIIIKTILFIFTKIRRKTDTIRNIDLEVTRKMQQKSNLEEDLENILGEADLES